MLSLFVDPELSKQQSCCCHFLSSISLDWMEEIHLCVKLCLIVSFSFRVPLKVKPYSFGSSSGHRSLLLLSSNDHLDPIDTYDMLTGPREFDLWKGAWRDQVSKAARSVHPSLIKVKCLLEMKKCPSPTTWHWVQNYHTLEGHPDDPEAILKALKDHAHKTAIVANVLLKAMQVRADLNLVKVNSSMAKVISYFQRACNDNS